MSSAARRRWRPRTRRTWTASRTEGRVGLVRTIPRRLRERQRRRDDVPARLRPEGLPHRPGAARGGGAEHSAVADRLGLSLQSRHRRRRDHEGPLGRRDHRRGGADAHPRAGAEDRCAGVRVLHRRELSQSAGLSRRAGVRRHDQAAARDSRRADGEIPAARARAARSSATIIDRSAELFANHEINEVRRQTGLNPASQVWLWGQGHAPSMPKFKERFGVDKRLHDHRRRSAARAGGAARLGEPRRPRA